MSEPRTASWIFAPGQRRPAIGAPAQHGMGRRRWLSPDGKLLAVQVMNGSNKPKGSPLYAPNGKLLLFRVDGARLQPLAAA